MRCQVVVGVMSICVQPVFDELEPICVVPPDDATDGLEAHVEPGREAQAAVNMCTEPSSAAPENPEAAHNMSAQPTSAAPENPEAADELEPDREPDMFDNAEEYVGVDDEGMYDTVPPAPEFAQPTDNANNYSTAEPPDEFVNVEAEVDDADPLELHVLHDPENPKIVKGELFPDIIAFRKAIRHYAVKTGFEFAVGYKTDKTRFIARCAAEGCPWRIHASTIFDKKTVQVHFPFVLFNNFSMYIFGNA